MIKKKLLSHAELGALNEQILAGSHHARVTLHNSYAPYVKAQALKWARQYKIPPFQWDDVIAACNLRAYETVLKFDPNISPSYKITLFYPLKSEVERFAGHMAYSVTMHEYVVSTMRHVTAATRRLRLAGEPTLEEIMLASRASARDAGHFSQPHNVPSVAKSLDAPQSAYDDEEGRTLADTLSSDDLPVFYGLQVGGAKGILADALDSLPPREAYILREYVLGTDDGDHRTLEELGQEFGVSKERVRQLKEKALEKLRIYMRKRRLVYEDLSAG